MQDQDTAHFNMLEQQVRPNEVSNSRVLDALRDIKRPLFVEDELQGLAYAGIELPIGYGQTMLSTLLQAKILQALDIQVNEDVLEIGTGTGYFTALLAQLAHHVTSVEIIPELSETARQHLEACGIKNVSLEIGDASRGWPLADRIDVIIATAAFVTVPDEFLQSLKVGGRMLAIVGQEPAMNVQVIYRVTERQWHTETITETVVPAIINAEPKVEFEF